MKKEKLIDTTDIESLLKQEKSTKTALIVSSFVFFVISIILVYNILNPTYEEYQSFSQELAKQEDVNITTNLIYVESVHYKESVEDSDGDHKYYRYYFYAINDKGLLLECVASDDFYNDNLKHLQSNSTNIAMGDWQNCSSVFIYAETNGSCTIDSEYDYSSDGIEIFNYQLQIHDSKQSNRWVFICLWLAAITVYAIDVYGRSSLLKQMKRQKAIYNTFGDYDYVYKSVNENCVYSDCVIALNQNYLVKVRDHSIFLKMDEIVSINLCKEYDIDVQYWYILELYRKTGMPVFRVEYGYPESARMASEAFVNIALICPNAKLKIHKIDYSDAKFIRDSLKSKNRI